MSKAQEFGLRAVVGDEEGAVVASFISVCLETRQSWLVRRWGWQGLCSLS